MTKKEEWLKQIEDVKHNFEKLIPATINLMFDACVGIIFDDYSKEIEKIRNTPEGVDTTFLYSRAESEYAKKKQFITYLKEKITTLYMGVKNESKKDKTEKQQTDN